MVRKLRGVIPTKEESDDSIKLLFLLVVIVFIIPPADPSFLGMTLQKKIAGSGLTCQRVNDSVYLTHEI